MTAREALLAQRFVALADTLVDDYDVVDVLDRLVHTTVELLPVVEAGLLLLDGLGAPQLMASTSERTRIVELFQLQNLEGGPCIECVRSGEPVTVGDLRAEDQRWPVFAAHAVGQGFRSVHAVPLRVRREVIGALNLFGGDDAPTDDDWQVAQALADFATLGILQQRSQTRASWIAEQLHAALATRAVIEQAKGMLAEAGRIDMERACGAMRTYAHGHGHGLHEVAQALVSGERRTSEVLGD